MVGGVDAKGPSLFNIDMFGSVENKNYVTTGSGSPVAYGLLEEEYKTDLTLEDAKTVCITCSQSSHNKKILELVMEINIALIDKNGFRLLTEEQKKSILSL